MSENAFLSFGEFYSEIRSHFSRNTADFEELKRRTNGRKKVEYLLDHEVVQQGLKDLSVRNAFKKDRKVSEIFEQVSDDFVLSNKFEGFKGTEKYPQLSHKGPVL
jgi:hypothetical protein